MRTRPPQAPKRSPFAPSPGLRGSGTVSGGRERPPRRAEPAPPPGAVQGAGHRSSLLPGGGVRTLLQRRASEEDAPSLPALHAEDSVQFTLALQRHCHVVLPPSPTALV